LCADVKNKNFKAHTLNVLRHALVHTRTHKGTHTDTRTCGNMAGGNGNEKRKMLKWESDATVAAT